MAQQEERPAQVRGKAGGAFGITALVAPPYSLSKALMEKIKKAYSIIEANALQVSEIERSLQRASKQPSLVLLSSLDGIAEQSRLCKLKLFAYKCSETGKAEAACNFYLEPESYYAAKSFANVRSAALLRKEVEKIIKVASSLDTIKLTNPDRVHVGTVEELLVLLQLQAAPSLSDT